MRVYLVKGDVSFSSVIDCSIQRTHVILQLQKEINGLFHTRHLCIYLLPGILQFVEGLQPQKYALMKLDLVLHPFPFYERLISPVRAFQHTDPTLKKVLHYYN